MMPRERETEGLHRRRERKRMNKPGFICFSFFPPYLAFMFLFQSTQSTVFVLLLSLTAGQHDQAKHLTSILYGFERIDQTLLLKNNPNQLDDDCILSFLFIKLERTITLHHIF